MIVVRDVVPYLVGSDEPVLRALAKIEVNQRRCVVVIDDEGRLVGTLTDGDVRRWLVSSDAPVLTAPAGGVANRDCVHMPLDAASSVVSELLDKGLDLVPLLDARGRVAAVAVRRSKDVTIAGRRVSAADPTFVIAEIGINHNGDIETAKRLVEAAARAGADCAKFQMRDLASLYRAQGAGGQSEDLGVEYTLDLLAEMSLSSDEILGLMEYASEIGLVALCTPWDRASADVLANAGVPAFKVASADLTNHPLLTHLAGIGVPLIVSTGMSTEAEIEEAVEVLMACSTSYGLLHCNSTYPVAYKDINLRYMERLAEIGNCVVGYSGHERGSHVAVAAVAMGARIIEKHITVDRTMRGNDHVVSLEPDEFRGMVQEIRELEAALGTASARTLTQGEQLNRLSLAKSLVAARDLSPGTMLTSDDVEVRSPGRGLQPNRMRDLVGRTLGRHIAAGDFFYESDASGAPSSARQYRLARPWGIPVRFHDWMDLAGRSNPDFLEFHLSYRDMDLPLRRVFTEKLPYSLVVHSPDLFTDDHILDLAALEDAQWTRSIAELQRVADLTREMQPYFAADGQVKIVASLGGSTMHEPLPVSERARRYERVTEAVSRLDLDGVELLAQTLPPFPWYLGGQRYCNLFVDPTETAAFSRASGIRLCLDIAHTKLACTHLRRSFADAIEELAPVAGHLHLVDAAGLDAEGLQIQEGDVDWVVLAEQLNRLAPNVSFIPEIWQGHVAGGLGFWIAMERLEALLNVEAS